MAITRAAGGTTRRHNPWPRLRGKKVDSHHSRRSRHSPPAQPAGTTHGPGSGERRRAAITHVEHHWSTYLEDRLRSLCQGSGHIAVGRVEFGVFP